jgi:diguanylate cyclase (GGDEF)-like protein/PAS domain S-box-containing protein
MPTLRKIKFLLAIVIVCFVAAAVYISALVVERQQSLEQISRYNVAWLVSQAATEYARLEQRISAYGLPGAGISADEVQLRFDIILNRMRLLESGEVEEFLDSDPDHRATVHELQRAVASGLTLAEKIGEGDNAVKLLQLLSPLDGKVVRLAAAANRWGGERVAEDQRQLILLHWRFSSMAAGLILCGIALITLLFWHNRMLTGAQRDLRNLAGELGTQNERFDAALTNMSQALCMVDAQQQLIVCNQGYRELFGLDRDLVRPGTSIMMILARLAELNMDDDVLGAIFAEQHELVRDGRAGSFFHEMTDGRTLAVSHQPTEEGGWVATYEDISERRRAEARIAHMAHHDALTDLPNRVLMRERIEHAFARARRYGEIFTVLCLDLDRFKSVNDTLGHPVGDTLLKIVADRLRSCVRESDVIARMGGDEFAILQIGADSAHDTDHLAQRVLELIGRPYDLDGQQVVIGTSVGIALAPRDGDSADQLLKNADLALYRAKSGGRGTYRFFEAGMDAELQTRRLLELDLRKALAAGEFEVYYQPLVSLATREITGYEALLRWHHPTRGFVPPMEFIGIAEDIGLIVPIGEWVLRQACTQAASWTKPHKIAVNLSPLQLKAPNLTQTVILALANSGLDAKRLELEITESVFLEDNELTLSTLHDLRRLGVRIAMDDFGTGYSSLSYLRSFPFDKIKLDKSFVDDLSTRADSVAIVKSIAMLGASLGMTTTAEGVETADQLKLLQQAGFLEGQGYLFGRPAPAKDIARGLVPDKAVRAA